MQDLLFTHPVLIMLAVSAVFFLLAQWIFDNRAGRVSHIDNKCVDFSRRIKVLEAQVTGLCDEVYGEDEEEPTMPETLFVRMNDFSGEKKCFNAWAGPLSNKKDWHAYTYEGPAK